MKKIIVVSFAVLLILTSLVSADDAGELKNIFLQYGEAALRSDGEAAVTAFSESAFA